MTTTETATGQFFAAPPMAGPVLPWRPEYGTHRRRGRDRSTSAATSTCTRSPDYTLDVNTRLRHRRRDGVVVLDSQLLPRHAEAVAARHPRPHRRAHPVRDQQPPPPRPRLRQPRVRRTQAPSWCRATSPPGMIDQSSFWYLMFLAGYVGGHLPQGYAVPAQHLRRARASCGSGKTAVQLFEFTDSTTVSGESVDVTMAWFPQSKVLHVADTVWPGAHTFFADGTSVPDWFIQLGHLRELVNELKPRVIVPGHGAPGDAGMIDAQERYLRAVSRMVEDYCRGGEVPLDDEAKAKLRQEIINEFPEHRNHIPLDISLQLLQMLGPMAFLAGRPDGATAARLPTFL